MQVGRAQIGDAVAGVVLVLIAWYVLTTASGFRGDGWLTPTVLAYLVGLGGVVLIVQAAIRTLRARVPAEVQAEADADEPTSLTVAAMLLPLALVVATVIYVLLIPRLGFHLASLLFIPAVLAFLGMRRWWVYPITALGFVGFVHLVFERTFTIPLPRAAWLPGLL